MRKVRAVAYRAFWSGSVSLCLCIMAGCHHKSGGEQAERYFHDPSQLRMAHAIENEDVRSIADLIASGVVKPNDHSENNPNVPQFNFLSFATELHRKASVRALLDHGADSNARTPQGWSAMVVAAASADSSLLQMLVAAGGNINIKGPTDEPISFDAWSARRMENLRYILDHGVDLNAQDTTGDTLLVYFADLNAYDEMLELLGRGADPHIPLHGKSYVVAWEVQQSAGRLTPDGESKRQKVIQALKDRGIAFPIPPPPRWDSNLHKYVDTGK